MIYNGDKPKSALNGEYRRRHSMNMPHPSDNVKQAPLTKRGASE